MNSTISFALEQDVQHIKLEDYNEGEFAIARLGFLSTRPNSHGLEISESVLRESAPSALGKWLVAKMNTMGTDATSHEPTEHIMGIIPKDQDIEFVEDEDGYLRAYADVVVSKVYSKQFCDIFANGEDRAVSVEMTVSTENGKGLDDIVNSFNIIGVTVLGASVNPSCPESNIEFVRFAENAETYFGEAKKFAEEKKTYKVDKSKESLSDKAWGDVDKTALRNKIIEASNASSLVKDVYLLVEDGWEDAPSEHLKYPVMDLKGDTFVYNRGGLASALGYAEKENETSVVNKIKKIYKSLDIEETRKEGESKMAENIKTEETRKLAEPEDAEKQKSFAEEEKEKDEEEKDEAKMESTDDKEEDKKSEDEKKEDEEKAELEDPDPEKDEEKKAEMSADEMKAEMARLQAEIDSRDNIIMEKDAELEELKAYKQAHMEAERASKVQATMEKYASFMDEKTAKSFNDEGLQCDFAALDGWANKVAASVADAVIKQKSGKKDNEEFTRMSAVKKISKVASGSALERLRERNQ